MGNAWIAIGGVAVVLILIRLIYGDDKTRLFRRVWSSERLLHSSPQMAAAQREAISALIKMYGIVHQYDRAAMLHSTTPLFVDSLAFDIVNHRNGGVTVTPVLRRALKARFPNLEYD